MSTSDYTIFDMLNIHKKMQEEMDKTRNPNGPKNHVVRLENMLPGEILFFRQFVPGTKPVEVGRALFKEGQNRLSIDENFKGLIVGKPKDPNKKFEIVYVGFSDEEVKNLSELEEKVNKTKPEQK